MLNRYQVVFLSTLLYAVLVQVRAQNFHSTYNTPFQNSFAFATPNLKQVFTTRIASGSRLQQYSQQDPQNTLANFQHQGNLPANYFPAQNGGIYSTTPQQFVNDDQLRQQLAYYQQDQLQRLQQEQIQQQQQYLEQFQAPFIPSQRVNNVERQSSNQQPQEEVRTQNLLGVAYSPSTQVSQVKFDNGKLKYDF